MFAPSAVAVEFFTDGVRRLRHRLAGKDCPSCGTPLEKDGFDIPFETFMGFHGDKVPDIDLIFPVSIRPVPTSMRRSCSARTTCFGPAPSRRWPSVRRMGTCANFLKPVGQEPRNAEVDRLVRGFSGVRRTTGQHPGGLIVVPQGRDIHEFTPVQFPANDRDIGRHHDPL